MIRNREFGQVKGERKKLSFFKVFNGADLSSECMRAFPYDLMRSISEKDFSYKMVIRAKWGSSWEVGVSKNSRCYYMEKRGWDKFVSDNALGRDEFTTFTHTGKMCFNVSIFEQNCRELLKPRKPPTMADPIEIKKEEGECSYKDVKKEEETVESSGGVDVGDRKKKAKESKTSKKKAKESKTSEKKKKMKVPEFKITIRKSYLKFLAIPKQFVNDHIPDESKIFTVHHPKGDGSWQVLCLVREARTIFSSGWTKLARDFPLLVGDKCTFKLIDSTEFLLVISKKARKKITKGC
ncbi:unnamed protein product [Microthlaspi erraticum]|uniref:TF-B3 domain-containing protein n=1 Tax=Microthlaspi erraticum TaxID=1685480 RepID=A0A6D2HM15_9BRAS|nr:unnamed protein product [Microthlaspi erraticum]